MTIIFYNPKEKSLVADRRIKYNDIYFNVDDADKIFINSSNTIAYGQCGELLETNDLEVLDVHFQNWYYDPTVENEEKLKDFLIEGEAGKNKHFLFLILTKSKLFWIHCQVDEKYWLFSELKTDLFFGYGSGVSAFKVCVLAKIEDSKKIVEIVHLSDDAVSREFSIVYSKNLKAMAKTRKIHA